MQIKDIIGINNSQLIYGNIEEYLNNFSKDTRTISKNATYVGIKGEVYDGNTFYKEAIIKGAKTCILSNIKLDNDFLKKYNCNIILVDDSITFLKEIAQKKRASLNIPFIAVTGSVGKTSTKNIIADTLSCQYKVAKTEGNLNTLIGLCLTILNINAEEVAVIEMGMNQKGEIKELTNIAKPTHAVITNIGTAHIGNLGSRKNILKAKLEILDGLSGPILINNDNDLLNNWAHNAQIKNEIITYGITNSSKYMAQNITYSLEGSSFTLNNEEFNLNVLGKHFIYNALVALAIGELFNIPKNLIKEKFKMLKLEPHRLNIINKNNYTIIDDTYNASYDSIYYALDIMSTFPNRKVVVLGDILELGNYGIKIHQDIGKLILQNKIDVLITIGNLAQYINEEAIKNGFKASNSYHFLNNNAAIICLKKIISSNDIILLKASHSMNFLEILNSI